MTPSTLPSPSVQVVVGLPSGTLLASIRSLGTSLPPGGTGLSNSGSSTLGEVGSADVVSVGPLLPGPTGVDVAQAASTTSSTPAPIAVPRLLMTQGRIHPTPGLPTLLHSYPIQ